MKKVALLLCLVLLVSMALPVWAEEAAFQGIGVVHTQYGDVSGVPGATENVTVFKGVPYAAAPVGELRWREPQDHEGWEGVRACDTYAAAAMQGPYTKFLMRPGSDFYPAGAPAQSEDCLYLNVTTPAVSADEKLPVMVWFHGGGLAHGYSWQVPFDGEKLAAKGVIVVTVGHRLGAMGFISLPQLTAESEYGASGNYGLMDCIKSVQWVHENIAAFGGDPDRVMVFGQSGGGGKTLGTVAAPQTQGMVSCFSTQSSFSIFSIAEGSSLGLSTLADNEETGLQLLDALGVSRDATLEELRAIPAETIYSVNEAASGNMVIDGKYITETRADFYLGEGNLNDVAMMAGWVFGEKGSYEATDAADLYAKLREKYGDLVDKYDLENTFPITEANVGYYNYLLKQNEALDEIRLYAKLKAERNENSPTYIYSFGRVTPNKSLGWHSGELWYMFNSMGYSFEGMDTEWQPAWEVYDYMVGETTSSYWSNFAGNDDPNAPGLVEWPAANAENQPYQYIDVVTTSFDELTPFDQMVMEYYTNLYGLGE